MEVRYNPTGAALNPLPGVQSNLTVPSWLVDDLIDSYVSWREESHELTAAYGRWSSCDRADRPLAVAAYTAAVDREERAADVYRECVARVTVSAL
jgi:hypothetical protein